MYNKGTQNGQDILTYTTTTLHKPGQLHRPTNKTNIHNDLPRLTRQYLQQPTNIPTTTSAYQHTNNYIDLPTDQHLHRPTTTLPPTTTHRDTNIYTDLPRPRCLQQPPEIPMLRLPTRTSRPSLILHDNPCVNLYPTLFTQQQTTQSTIQGILWAGSFLKGRNTKVPL